MESLANNMTNQTDTQERGWEYRHVTVTRVPGYGFGIAVSGGRDNPHFSSGDPSIAVSDVLPSGPAERLLLVNDRILSVNGISLQNVDYATAVQVLRDSGDTVLLSIKRRAPHHAGTTATGGSGLPNHQHSHSLSASYGATASSLGTPNVKVMLTKNSKKEDFGIVLGCKLFVKEISSKARDQLANTNQLLLEGDFVTKINNTNCNDMMSLKEAKKIMDSCKDKLTLVAVRDSAANTGSLHQQQSSVSTTGAVNNYYSKGGEDGFNMSNQSYSNQNLYVQPPTRHSQHQSHATYLDDRDLSQQQTGSGSLTNGGNVPSTVDDKSNLAPRGRLRGPINDVNLSRELETAVTNHKGRTQLRDTREPPRPPPPRPEDYYSSRRQLYEDDPLLGKSKQAMPDARFIAFQKEGSVGIRLTGGNHAGIFVTAVQPGSPASLQGLQPGDKILKVNDMDMTGVTREEAVLFLLSLQDRIELIVQLCKEEYDVIVASQKGDSFYIKTHFHYESPVKGEMTFRSGDIFHVIDTLYNGVVGCWQVFRIGRNNQEVQKGIIPNKARAEELATAQFNATKKEMSASESRGSFFRRRRSSSRRSKSLGKEHWDDILFSDSVSKFPAYERVVLRHPGFMRPVILFGPIADIARDKLLKDFPDKFISPQLENGIEEAKSQKSSHIIRLSAIRDVISTGKHALLDITPNAVERLNYAQLYPIVVFLKADTKIVIKQLRQGLPKSAHKSSKKLLEQCQRLDKVWGHIFSATITLNDASEHWYRKLRETLDRQQAGALWMSETKPRPEIVSDLYFPPLPPPPQNHHNRPYSTLSNSLPKHYRPTSRRAAVYSYPASSCNSLSNITATCKVPHYYTPPEESLSDDFLFPMSSLRLSYASSPESDLEHSPGPPGINNSSTSAGGVSGTGGNSGTNTSGMMPVAGRLTKASSDPSVAMADTPDHGSADIPPPYQATYDSKYGFANQSNDPENSRNSKEKSSNGTVNSTNSQDNLNSDQTNIYGKSGIYGQNMHSSNQINEYSQNMKTNSHERQKSSLHSSGLGNYGKSLGDSNSRLGRERSPNRSPKDSLNYGSLAPDLPPRIDRASKPSGLLTKGGTVGRSAHERLFGTKAPGQLQDMGDQNNSDSNQNNKESSLERRQPNAKSGSYDSMSSYDSFNTNNNQTTNKQLPSSTSSYNHHHHHQSSSQRLGPNAHDDLKSSTNPSSIDLYKNDHNNSSSIQNNHHQQTSSSSSAHQSGKYPQSLSNNKWGDQPSPTRYGSKYNIGPNMNYDGRPGDNYEHQSPRNSLEIDKNDVLGKINQRSPDGRSHDYSRYSRSPGKSVSSRLHLETKTDYGKYSRNNGSMQDFMRKSQLDLNGPPPLSLPQSGGSHGGGILTTAPSMQHLSNGLHNGNHSHPLPQPGNNNSNSYKPVPPPKPKNYKPPFKNQSNYGFGDDIGPNNNIGMQYQHGKSNSHPAPMSEQRSPNYYYNVPPAASGWHNDGTHFAQPMSGNYDAPPPPTSSGNGPPYDHHRHSSHYDGSRGEQRMSGDGMHYNPNQDYRDHGGFGSGDNGHGIMDHRGHDHRNNIVDLQGSREQRGSAFELYRKPIHHNMSSMDQTLNNSMHDHLTNSSFDKPTTPQLNRNKHSQPNTPVLARNKHIKSSLLSISENGNHYSPIMSKKNSLLSLTENRPHELERNKHIKNSLLSISENYIDPYRNYSSPNMQKKNSFLSLSENYTNDVLYQNSPLMIKKNELLISENDRSNKNYSPIMSKKDSVLPISENETNQNLKIDRLNTNLNDGIISFPDERGKNFENICLKNGMIENNQNVTSSIIDHKGGHLINKYWGVSLEIPEGAISYGIKQEIYFVISDPRDCENAPPLDLENGEAMLSPLVMCGPQGLEFKKPVILNIPHYAHTLPSLAISLKATDSERDLCTDWDNILLPSNHTANSVAVKVDHF